MILSVTLNPCVDHTLFVERLNLHDANRVERMETDAGGKGCNLSRIVAELGGETVATGFLGGDTGRFVANVLDRQRVVNSFIPIEGESRTNFSIEDGTGAPPTTFNGRGPMIAVDAWLALQRHVLDLAKRARWVAIGGSAPPGLPSHPQVELLRTLKTQGHRVLIDADGPVMAEALNHRPDLIKPNAMEAERLLGFSVQDTESAVRAAKALQDRTEGVVIVSLGAKGAVLCRDRSCWVGTSPKVEACSTIGSGDSMLGAYLWAESSGLEIAEALRWGLAAGAATAMTDGSEIGRKPVIESLLDKASVESWD